MPHKELSKFSAARLEKFMQRRGYTRRQAAQALGITERMLYKYLRKEHQVPQTLYLLVKALEAEAKQSL